MKRLGIDSIIYSSGTLLNSALGLFFFILVARELGPAEFGIVSVIIAISVVASDIFDFGMNTSMLKFLSQADDSGKNDLAKDFLSYKIISSVLVILLGLISSPFLARVLFKNQVPWSTVLLGFLAAGSLILYGYVNSNLQARKRFASSAVFNLTSNAIRLVMTVYLFSLSTLNTSFSLVIYLLPIIAVTVIWGLVDPHITLRPRLTKAVFLPVVKYGRWVAGSVALSSITSRLDNFLLVNLSSTFQTGIYTSVQRFFLAFNQIPAGISLVTTPDLSSRDSEKSNRALKFGVGTSILTAFGLLIFIFLAPWLIPLVLGASYRLSVIPSQLLAVGTTFFVLASPLNSFILYTKEKSHRLFILTAVQLAATIIFNWLLIPTFQAQGAAMAYSLTSLLGLLVTLFFFLR